MKDRVRKLAGEGFVIVASVYVAIFLGTIANDHERKRDARDGIVQVRSDIRSDSVVLQEIIAEQVKLRDSYADILRWIDSPPMPADSFNRALFFVTTNNRTMFPRRGAWTSVVANGMLADIGNDALVTHLSSFYENMNDRLEYNGRDYDLNTNDIARTTIAAVWNPEHGVSGDLRLLRNQLGWVRKGWTIPYLEMLIDYGRSEAALLKEMDAYLARK